MGFYRELQKTMRNKKSETSSSTVTENVRRTVFPRFFKVFLPDLCSHRLGISPAFIKHIDDRNFPWTCSMKGPSGHIWNVEVVSEEKDGVFFDRGWKEFAKDHSLELGNFMVFEYIGDRRFSMLLFDSSACEKVEALSAKPSGCSKEVVLSSLKRREDRPNFRYLNRRVLLSHRRSVTSSEIRRAMEAARSFKSDFPFFIRSIRRSDIYLHNKMYIPKQFAAHYLPNASVDFILQNQAGKLYNVRVYWNKKDQYITSGWRVFVFENNIEEDDACVFELVKERQFNIYIHRVVKELAPPTWAIEREDSSAIKTMIEISE
ncbi:hypothetical protein ZOSMA_82G00130 [Zostera marina]|uniref:TF-B3 domain-containing protein n=1 Tax=Zostera marina TaxID=29655 RepID=A0A0K9NLT1_ZOSMR|nr:hypothetical protein ZOSMA_82G00130 [Zostera marina]